MKAAAPAMLPLSLRQRVFLILLLALVFVQVLSFIAVGWSRGFEARHLANDLIARDIVKMQTQLTDISADQRPTFIRTLDRATYYWRLVDATDVLPIVNDDSSLMELARRSTNDKAIGRAQPVRWQNSPALRMPLADAVDLLVVFPDGLPRSTPSASAVIAYVLSVTASVALVTWFAVTLAIRPLARAAAAARAMTKDLSVPWLEELGPPEVRDLTRSLNQLRQEVQRQLHTRTRILAAVTHDLKTPITRLQLRIASLADIDLRARMQADLEAMATLVDEGLTFAGSETLHEPMVLVDLNALIENLVEQTVDLGYECLYEPSSLPPVWAVPQALARLLQNLINNALRYGGSAEVQVTVSDGMVNLSVADHGPGLAQADLERMFEPFVRGDPSRGRDMGGTGLGLAIARNLAQAHRGTLLLEQRQGGGLVARLSWPQQAVFGSEKVTGRA